MTRRGLFARLLAPVAAAVVPFWPRRRSILNTRRSVLIGAKAAELGFGRYPGADRVLVPFFRSLGDGGGIEMIEVKLDEHGEAIP